MIPNPAEVVRRQWTVTGVFRILALCFGVLGVLAGLMGLVFAFTVGATESWRRDEVLFSLFFCTGIGVVLFGVGAGLFLAATKLARSVARYPKSVPCPRCFYGLEGLVEPRCSECGLDLTIEFLPPQQLRPAPESIAHTNLRHRMVFTPIVRLIALLLVFPLGGALLGLVTAWMNSIRYNDSIWREPTYLAVWVWWLASAGVVGSVIVFPRIWVSWIVPSPSARQLRLVAGDDAADLSRAAMSSTSADPAYTDPASAGSPEGVPGPAEGNGSEP